MMRTARLAVAVTIALLAAACSGGAAPTEETGVLGVSIERPAASEPAAAVTRTPTPTPTATTTPSETSSPTETAPPPPPPPAPEPEPEPPPPPPEPEPEPDPEPTPVAPFTVYSSSLSYSDGFVTEASSTTTDPQPPATATLHHEVRDDGTVVFACSGTLTPPEGHTATGTLTLTLFEGDAALMTVSSPGLGTEPTSLALGPHETDNHDASYECELTYSG